MSTETMINIDKANKLIDKAMAILERIVAGTTKWKELKTKETDNISVGSGEHSWIN